MDKDTIRTLNKVVQIDEGIRDHLGELVRGTVEETLNSLLGVEADRLCNAPRYVRTPEQRSLAKAQPEMPRQLHVRRQRSQA